ncbi:MAG: hypothetical protein QOF05_375 [Sphingomonadales bacterium]|jgi:hypothetical protein|nr:hypothetical protein [Sphingomonadales bacterium]
MTSEASEQRPGFSDLLAELTDSDVVVEVVASASSRRPPEVAHVQRLQEAVEASYRALGGSAPVQTETVAVLEEVGRRSLSLWLRVRAAGAAAGEEEASLLKFLARGTLAIIAWMDGSSTHQLADLQQAIRVLAWGTSITTSAHPVLPSSADLVSAIAAWQKAKTGLGAGSSVRISTNNGSADLDLGKTIDEPRALLQARKLVNHSADMIFVVEMPDYQATGQWQLKHGGTRTLAYSEPGTLLDKFYRRELDIRPGDALRCRVDFETSYGPDHEVLSERYRIVEILEVLPAARGADVQPLQPAEPARRETAAELEPAS